MTFSSSRLPRLLAVKDLAAELKLSPKTIRRLIKRGELRAHHVGRQLRVPEHEVVAYLNKNLSDVHNRSPAS